MIKWGAVNCLPMEQTAQKGLYYIDILNILSCFAVVVLHCSGGVFSLSENTPLVHIYVFADRSSFCRARVFYDNRCKFYLITAKKYDTKTFFKKSCRKNTCTVSFFRSLLYWVRPFVLKQATAPMSAKGLFLAIFNNEANYVFWFFYCIFGRIYVPAAVFARRG